MNVTNEFEIDLTCNPNKRKTPEIQAYQRERISRKIAFSLKDGCQDWIIPPDVICLIRFVKPDGHGGVYSILPDESNAWSVEGNQITFTLVPQMLDLAGQVDAEAVMLWGDHSLTITDFHIIVARNPDITEEVVSDYYNVQNLEQINTALTSLYSKTVTDATLSMEGKSADAAAVGETVRQLSGEISSITPAKIGAKAAGAIEGFATGGTGAHTAELAMSNLSELHFNGDWQTAQPGISAWHYEVDNTEELRAQYNIPHGGCEILVMKRSANRGAALAFGWTMSDIRMWRSFLHDDTGSNKWSSWVDVKDAIGANFDSAVEYINGSGDLNYATQPGRFYGIGLASGIANLPPVSDVNSLNNAVVYNYGQNGVLTQIYYAPNARQVIVRYYVSWNTPQWSEWEFVAPPMNQGVEFRTIERWNGKAVYTTLFNFGLLPNNSSAFTEGRYNATRVIRASGMTIDGNFLTFPARWQEYDETSGTTATREIGLMAATWGVNVFTNFDASSMNAYVQVWYTKD